MGIFAQLRMNTYKWLVTARDNDNKMVPPLPFVNYFGLQNLRRILQSNRGVTDIAYQSSSNFTQCTLKFPFVLVFFCQNRARDKKSCAYWADWSSLEAATMISFFTLCFKLHKRFDDDRSWANWEFRGCPSGLTPWPGFESRSIDPLRCCSCCCCWWWWWWWLLWWWDGGGPLSHSMMSGVICWCWPELMNPDLPVSFGQIVSDMLSDDWLSCSEDDGGGGIAEINDCNG